MTSVLKEFEEDASSWEEKLNKLNIIFDIWIDVQRRYIYLDGIFGSSVDIKHLLPNESQKFLMLVLSNLSTHQDINKTDLKSTYFDNFVY